MARKQTADTANTDTPAKPTAAADAHTSPDTVISDTRGQERRRPEQSSGAEAKIDDPLSEIDRLVMQIHAGALYHESREAFCAGIQRFSSWLGIISGTALVALARGADPMFSYLFGFFVSALSGAVLVLDFGGLTRRHRECRVKLMDLAGEAGAAPELVEEFRRKYEATFATDPLTFHAANAVAINAIQSARGRSDRLLVNRWQYFIRNFWRFSPATFEWQSADRRFRSSGT